MRKRESRPHCRPRERVQFNPCPDQDRRWGLPYNINPETGQDEAKPVIEKLHEQGIAVWGWHYIYGQKPKLEADSVVARALSWELTASLSTLK